MVAASPPLVVSSSYQQSSSSSASVPDSVPTAVPVFIPSITTTAAAAAAPTSAPAPSSAASVSAPPSHPPHNGSAPIPTQTHSYHAPAMNPVYPPAPLYYPAHPHPAPPPAEYAAMPGQSMDMSMMPPLFYARMPYLYSTPPIYNYPSYVGYYAPAPPPTGYMMPPQMPASTPYYAPMMTGPPGPLPPSAATPVARTWTRHGQGRGQAGGHRPRALQTSGAGMTAASASGKGGAGTGVSPTVVRGPPRKPRQSGYAVWIGNLPVKTDLMDLVAHVCDLTTNLESLFLIAKSNCAFANFTDEASWHAALAAVHDSEFRTMRLVARHRRLSPEGAAASDIAGLSAPASPEAAAAAAAATTKTDKAPDPSSRDKQETQDTDEPEKRKKAPPVGEPKKLAGPPPASARDARCDRFFVLKSLTVDDLQQSTRTGVWATQSHNEAVLNEAYTNAANVFLIFSANKSGEYFGYARMTSALNADPAAAIEFAPLSTPAADPATTPLAARVASRGRIPAGRIVNDALRGTIFWEVDAGDAAGAACPAATTAGSAGSGSGGDSGGDSGGGGGGGDAAKALGKPFSLTWLSTTPVGFQRTKGIANAWNGNREVKIARDGTEIEPAAGEKLVRLFHEA